MQPTSVPIQKPPPAVATPIAVEVTVSVDKAAAVGDIFPVYVVGSVATTLRAPSLPSQVWQSTAPGEGCSASGR
jgi:hypothetical protein